jgi:hypothetical protein
MLNLEMLKQVKDLVISFLRELMSVFVVDGLLPQEQQLAKLAIVILAIVFLAVLFWLITKLVIVILKGPIDSLSKDPIYVMAVIMSVLLLFFTSQVTFKSGCFALIFFVLVHYGNDWLKNQQKKNSDERRSE